MVKETEKLTAILSKIIIDRKDFDKISPTWIATEAMRKLHGMALQREKPLIYTGCHMFLRQLARGLCAETFEDKEGLAQHDLFPALQRRYPVARSTSSEEPQYIKLELMTQEDKDYNVDRLRKEGEAKLKHADALDAWWSSPERAKVA